MRKWVNSRFNQFIKRGVASDKVVSLPDWSKSPYRSEIVVTPYRAWMHYILEKCKNECDSVRVCERIKEMCSWRDKCDMILFNKEECSTINDF